jgi:argininosuccinate lyase
MNDSEGEVQAAGYAAFGYAARMLDLAAGLIGAVGIDGARVARNIDAACITVTELADTLVRKEGLSFRQAHEIAAATAKAVVGAGGSLGSDGYAPFREAFEAHAGRKPLLKTKAFAAAVSAENFVAVRDRFGGPAAASMDDALAVYRRRIDRGRAALEGFRREREHAATHLESLFSSLAKMGV